MMALRNIGIFAHVDAGKTTLSEQLLAHAGAIRTRGSVDQGTAHTDRLDVERRRGISVQATCVQFVWQGTRINLIDTPGHTDFSAEVERSLWALDGAILVVSGVEGVQPQTEVLFHALREQNIPILFFINKTDRESVDKTRVFQEIKTLLTPDCVFPDNYDALCELICGMEDDLLERYLAGALPDCTELRKRLKKLSRMGKVYPVLSGSALHDHGTEQVLDGIIEWLPEPVSCRDICGVVFAIQQDRTLGRGAWVRLYGGELNNRDTLTLPHGTDPITGEKKFIQQKITQIRNVDGKDIGMLQAGNIGIVYGLSDVSVGFVFGDKAVLPRTVTPGRLRAPLISVQVIPDASEQMPALRNAFQILTDEDPLLQARYSSTLSQLHLQIMGMIQLEILHETLESRFALKAHFSEPSIIYRETIAKKSIGFAAYTMPKPCWAILKFQLEPGERGSGILFRSTVPGKDILPRYQHQVEQALPTALSQGRLGWQVTDLKITLIDGSHHQFHTHPLDFIVATPWAIQDGLQRAGSILLEPILEIRFLLPPECVGKVMSDIHCMRGEVTDTRSENTRVVLTALVPAQTSLNYATDLAILSGGRGGMSVCLHSYRECSDIENHISPRRSIDPLDTARYILAARSALEGDIYDE